MRFNLFFISVVVVIFSCCFVRGTSATSGDIGTKADATLKIGIGARASAIMVSYESQTVAGTS